METAVKVWTDEELLALPKDGYKRELLQGEIILSPAGFDHEWIGARLSARMTLLPNNTDSA